MSKRQSVMITLGTGVWGQEHQGDGKSNERPMTLTAAGIVRMARRGPIQLGCTPVGLEDLSYVKSPGVWEDQVLGCLLVWETKIGMLSQKVYQEGKYWDVLSDGECVF